MIEADFKIDLTEEFGNLPNAPIVEAVIHWRARPEKAIEPDKLLEHLKKLLPEYPDPKRQQDIGVHAEFGDDVSSLRQQKSWHGFRFESKDKLNVAQFTRDGFVFSRLKPYEDWGKFEGQAQGLWQLYRDYSKPSEVQRLGVRFINQIAIAHPDNLNNILDVPPRTPDKMRLPLKNFMCKMVLDIPDSPYNLTVIQTIQPPSPPNHETFLLILDLDVFTTQSIGIGDDELKKRLVEMRWIKNKAFFTFLKQETIMQFREK